MSDAGISAAALIRAADAMLHALGGNEISLVFPLVSLPNDPSGQLGLADPGVQQVTFSPVVVRSLTTASAEALFEGALGVTYDGDLFHIEDVITEYFGGTPYLYRVTAVE
jgi:hypothetical protein